MEVHHLQSILLHLGVERASCLEWGGSSKEFLHQSGLQIHTGDALRLSSVLYTESTPTQSEWGHPHSQLLTLCTSCSPGIRSSPPPTHTQHSPLFSVRLTILVSWTNCRCLHRTICLSPVVGAERVHLASRGRRGGPKVGDRELQRQEGGETWAPQLLQH